MLVLQGKKTSAVRDRVERREPSHALQPIQKRISNADVLQIASEACPSCSSSLPSFAAGNRLES